MSSTDAFNRLAPFIQDFIYDNQWTELRGIQVAASEVIFDTSCNLLLSSGTASGKTEAAFLPILTDLYEHPSSSVGILYISPLKALINDQFKRLEQILMEGNIPVCKWHGDASVTKKNNLIKMPEGVLQITPESLESLLMNKRGACLKMFADLRYVVIDEVHHFMRDMRGIQVLCLLERLQRLTGVVPRRIGLSATLGDLSLAQNWLSTGTGRDCLAPVTDEGKRSIKLFVHRFVKAQESVESEGSESDTKSGTASHADSGDRAHFEYLFKMTLDKKTIIFTNSREETEFTLANLREIALKNKAPDVYRVHHGNVSAELREHAEDEMKTSEEKIVTGATVTLELGIDIGSLDQAVQIGAPSTVSSFAQRLGRCGRRGQVPQLLFTFVEDIQTTAADKLGPINWAFLRLIAIIELYTKERWIEPIPPQQHPYSLLYHQTMSCLKSNGELSPAGLAQEILSLSCFSAIPQEDYRLLLRHLIDTEHIQETERGGLIIGRVGEKVVNHFHFYTVFIVPEYYLVKDENKPIGTVDKIYPVGIRFSLAGITWETLEVNEKSKVIFVKRVPGISVVDWDVDFEAELHTKLVRTIRSILRGSERHGNDSDRLPERVSPCAAHTSSCPSPTPTPTPTPTPSCPTLTPPGPTPTPSCHSREGGNPGQQETSSMDSRFRGNDREKQQDDLKEQENNLKERENNLRGQESDRETISRPVYPYLSESCAERLNEIRYLALGSGITEQLVTQLSEKKFAVFPWVGTRQLFTLHFLLLARGIKSNLPWRTCVFLEVYYDGSAQELESEINTLLRSDPDLHMLPLPEKIEILSKYNEFIPPSLLRKQFIEDFLDFEGLVCDISTTL